MRKFSILVFSLALFVPFAFTQKSDPDQKGDDDSLVIVFKDGHQKTYSMSEVARIEFKTAKVAGTPKGQNRFLGKWQVGDGLGSTFFITLEPDGVAKKSIGSSSGTWAVVGSEARISWDDGWHDVIRKVGSKHEKVAYEPGKSFDDTPSNVTAARNTEQKSI